MDAVVEYARSLLDNVVSAMHEAGADSATPKNSFIRTTVIHPMLYNDDEEASSHDLSTHTGQVLAIANAGGK
jgi:hypothetical protein